MRYASGALAGGLIILETMSRSRKAENPEGGDSQPPFEDMVVIVDRAVNPYLVLFHDPTSFRAEQLRSLRNRLVALNPDGSSKTLVVTSAVRAEGKTVTAINLAISLTQTGARTLLVSTDLRKPRVDTVFGVSGAPGISGLLAGEIELDEAIVETGIAKLDVLPCGVLPPNPVELLMSSRFGELVSRLAGDYGFVVFDSPPLGNVSDARILARITDSTLLVVRASQTSKHLARHVMDQLNASGGRIAGVVLNDFDSGAQHDRRYHPKGHYSSRVASL